jgi:amino acid adenylation domain-containing protein
MAVPSVGDAPVNDKEQAQWFLHRLLPDQGICNIGFTLAVDCQLRWWPLQEALNHLLRRHPALRATFHATGTQLRKRFLPPDNGIPLETRPGTEEGLADQITALMATPLDVTTGPLVRGYLILLPSRSILCVAAHHLVVDAISMGVLLRELTELYTAYADGGVPPDRLAGEAAYHLEPDPDPAEIRYWVDHLRDVDPTCQSLGFARPTPARPTLAGGHLEYRLSADARRAVARMREGTRTTDNIVLLSAFYALLAAHGAGPVLAVGVMANARRGGVDPRVVGYHANTLPIQVRVDRDADFLTLVRQTRDSFMTGLEHGTIPFEAARHALPNRSEDWRLPLFRHSFNHRPRAQAGLTMAGQPVRVLEAFPGLSRLDIELLVFSESHETTVDAVYSTEIYRHDEIAALVARYEAMLVRLVDADDRPLSTLDVRQPADRELVLRTNATVHSGPSHVLPGVLTAARARPDRYAVGDWTYGRLSAAAQSVARALREHGVGVGDVVGLYAGRSPLLAAAVLGTWLAGAAYLPLDPAHPVRRNAFELTHAEAKVVLVDRAPPPDLSAGRAVIALGEATAVPPVDLPDLEVPTRPDDLAYVIYTSGSTGQPKGVEVTHRGLANVVDHFARELRVSPTDRVLWLTTYSFDISALELFLALSSGGHAVVAPDEARLDADRLRRLIVDRDVTVLQGTPTTWRQVVGRLDGELDGRRILCGGEPLTWPLADALLAAGCELFNVYGPTETTIWSTAARITRDPGGGEHRPDGAGPPIGRPVANTGVHVLDPAGHPVPPGMPGELWITGAGVARGYRTDPEHTARRFQTDPVAGRRYGTGDLVRQRLDGQLEFIGRQDRQVKVRGHRVEPGEVETLLEKHPEVVAAAVFTEPDPAGGVRLVAAVQPSDQLSTADPDDHLPARLREYLVEHLPSGAVPSRLVTLPRLPLTGNGKVDHTATATMAASRAPAHEPRRSYPQELQTLVTLWQEVLADPDLDADANFFLHGGHSVLAVHLAERVTTVLARPVTFEMVFEAPTPARLATLLAG